MDSQRQQAAERIKQANNILVTVSNNPSVDQLAACIGLTVSLNKMGKHATAVFSGGVPSTLEFLQPEKTIEKNTDSLRDFIIALDKSKADKLRYKVEDRVVKIFITPYRTSISDKDLEFSQGDFNVDVVIALGVHNQEELDAAITSHGRILHDATIVTLNTKAGGELGSINWLDPNASSLSELGVQLVNALDKSLVDSQVATAFLTGIVAETERFSNAKTSPQTMSVSAQLMSSGANQQLVATKLEEPAPPPPPPAAPIATQEPHEDAAPPEVVKKSNDGTLEITHDETKTAAEESAQEDHEDSERRAQEVRDEFKDELLPEPEEKPIELPPPPQIHIDEHGSLSPVDEQPPLAPEAEQDEDFLPPVSHEEPSISKHNEPPKMILEPPTLGGSLTASGAPGVYDPESTEGAGLPGMPKEEGQVPGSMDEDKPSIAPTIMPPRGDEDDRNAPGTSFLGDQPLVEDKGLAQPPHSDTDAEAGKTLDQIEHDVRSKHLEQAQQEPESVAPAAPAGDHTDDPIVSAFMDRNGGLTPPAPAAPVASPPAFNQPDVPGFADTAVPNMPVPVAGQPATPPPVVDSSLDEARNAVERAMNSAAADTSIPEGPSQSLNAQPLGTPLHEPQPGAPNTAPPVMPPAPQGVPADLPLDGNGQPQLGAAPQPYNPNPQPAPAAFGAPVASGGTPPGSPPPMMPPFPPAH